ncbi:MAG: hypothetical protein DRG78_02355 [Epsilonproteobacteria bacterium]|nr:MAG: hypothetical protein DRG78_02355 [Campylobacterota bacterium]
MTLIIDDNKTIAQNIIDELELDDIVAHSVHTVDEFQEKLRDVNFNKFTHIVMDYNLEDTMNGIELLELMIKKLLHLDKRTYLFSGNLSYISNNEKEFLANNNIKPVCKSELESLIDDIIDTQK